MIRVHQVLVSASGHDTITRASLSLQTELRRLGPSEIFARHVDPALVGSVRALDDFGPCVDRAGADLIVHHASAGAESVSAFLMERAEPLCLVYHDSMSDEDLLPYDATLAARLKSRHEELDRLAGRVALAIAESEPQAAELRALGYRQVVVSRFPVDAEALLAVPPDRRTETYLAALDGPKFLFAGELLPHKRLDWLLAAYHVLVTYLEPRAHLLLVGSNPSAPYRRALDTYVAELGLGRAHVMGQVSPGSLAACYRSADAFVTASEHESDCLPLREALAFDVPVVARRYASIPETLAGAGVILGPDDGPLVAAEAMAVLSSDEGTRGGLATKGRHRLGELDPRRASSDLVGHLESLIT